MTNTSNLRPEPESVGGYQAPPPHRRGRWYGNVGPTKPWTRGKVQADSDLRAIARDHRSLTLPEGVLRLAQKEYERQYGHGQDYERMQERGGLSMFEVVGLLADFVEHLGGKPTEPRATNG